MRLGDIDLAPAIVGPRRDRPPAAEVQAAPGAATTLPIRNENRLIDGIRSAALTWMTSHTLSFVHFLLTIAIALVVLPAFDVRRPAG